MSRKKKKDQQRQIPLSTSNPVSIPRHPIPPSSNPISTTMKFEAMEDKIRGEEILQDQEYRKIKEERDVKKKLDNAEVDRRLEALRKQLGLPKK